MAEAIAHKRGVGQFTVTFLARAWGGLVDFITPPKCLCCFADVQSGASYCVACWQKLSLIDEPLCIVLGKPFEYDQGEGAISAAALTEPPPWDRARAAVAFDAAAKPLIHGLKYHDTHAAGLMMARLMTGAGRKLLADADMLVPVPLHRQRLWRRRFNQAAFLADKISKATGKPMVLDILHRQKATRTQVGLNFDERARNVKKAFALFPLASGRIAGKNILLIDDVLTTGATAASCAAVLKAGGAARVDVLTFALVLDPQRLHIEV
jgi:ComF family protein